MSLSLSSLFSFSVSLSTERVTSYNIPINILIEDIYGDFQICTFHIFLLLPLISEGLKFFILGTILLWFLLFTEIILLSYTALRLKKNQELY